VLHANLAGQRLIASGGALRRIDGRLAAHDERAAERLRAAFAASSEAVCRAKGLDVSLTARDGDSYVAHVLPLTGGERFCAGANYAAACALFVHKAQLNSPSPASVIAQTYGLTPTELRVLLAIVEVGGAPEVAEALGVAESTVELILAGSTERPARAGRRISSSSWPVIRPRCSADSSPSVFSAGVLRSEDAAADAIRQVGVNGQRQRAFRPATSAQVTTLASKGESYDQDHEFRRSPSAHPA
jgi:hypothetical protein